MSKRKLNAHDVPEAAEPSSPSATPTKLDNAVEKTEKLDFSSFGLEPRLLQGIRGQKWSAPTTVQEKVIPLALEGKDILARSGTGTGKTAAYLLPILDKILRRTEKRVTSSLILVPTKELALQVSRLAGRLASYCGQDVRIQNLAGKESDVVQRAKLAENPDIVVATPARAAANMGSLSLKTLATLVIDEGDLILGYGFKDDLETVSQNMPKGVQIYLMSATLSTDVEAVQALFCRDPVVLKLDDLEKDAHLVKQYVIPCSEPDKFLLAYSLFKLQLIRGKTIVFVGDVDVRRALHLLFSS